MSQNLNIEEIKEKFYQKLIPSGWGRVLKSFIFSGDFDNIIFQLVKKSNTGEKFTPLFKDLFRAFEECPYDQLCVVIVNQDPYPTINIADGIAFSCSKTKIPQDVQPSLKYMLQEVNRTVYEDEYVSYEPDLSRWANQGILLLNTALTTTVGKIGAHYDIWKPFMAYLFDWLNNYNNGLVYIYMGKKAQEWDELVSSVDNIKYSTLHPASAVYSSNKKWDSKDVFVKVSEDVFNNYGKKLIW